MKIALALTSLLLAIGAAAVVPVALAQPNAQPLPATQLPIAAERNPPGDIPDNQAFVLFKSALGFSIKVPEGWARREQPSAVSFIDKYNALRVTMAPRSTPPSLASLESHEVAELKKSPKAVRVLGVKQAVLPAGPAFVVSYQINSDPNPVTNKAIRLDSVDYHIWKAGRLATVTVSAPAGADNADQWRLMSNSFAWQ